MPNISNRHDKRTAEAHTHMYNRCVYVCVRVRACMRACACVHACVRYLCTKIKIDYLHHKEEYMQRKTFSQLISYCFLALEKKKEREKREESRNDQSKRNVLFLVVKCPFI